MCFSVFYVCQVSVVVIFGLRGRRLPLGLQSEGILYAGLSFLIVSQALKKSAVQELWFKMR